PVVHNSYPFVHRTGMCCPPPISRSRGRRFDQGKHGVHRLHWIPQRLKSAHGPRDHASLKNTPTAVRPTLLKEGCERFLHVRLTPSRGPRLVLNSQHLLRGAVQGHIHHGALLLIEHGRLGARCHRTQTMLGRWRYAHPRHAGQGMFPAPLHARAIPVPRLKEHIVTAQSIERAGPSVTRQLAGWRRDNGAVRTGSQLPADWHESAKDRWEPLSGTGSCTTLRAWQPLLPPSVSTNSVSSCAASV